MAQNSAGVSISRIVMISGALIAFMLGSGFTTGQELMQYFVSYGYYGVLSIVMMFVMFTYVSVSFICAGNEQQFAEPKSIFHYYGGRWLGAFFDYFCVALLYMSFWVMIAGAGASVQQQFGMPVWLGGVALGAITLITLFAGFSRLVEVLGTIGPVLCVLVIAVGVLGLSLSSTGLTGFEPKVAELVEQGTVLQAGENWYVACASYVGFCMMWMAVFLANLGKTIVSRKEACWGAGIGMGMFSLAALLMTLSFAANLEAVASVQIPTLVLVEMIHPALAPVFSIILLVAIYTTAAPLLWAPVKRFVPDERSVAHRVLLTLLAVGGVVIGLSVPFATLINLFYVSSGYVGFFLLFLMLAKDVRTRLLHKALAPSTVGAGTR